MEAPLLNGVSPGAVLTDYAPPRNVEEWKRVFWTETVKVWNIAVPIAFSIVCMYAMTSVTTMFVGHIGNLELSAVSLSLNVVETFTFGFLLGMGSAVETLCGQAYGAGQLHMLGVYMQRSWIILFGCSIVLLPLYIFATPVLKFFGQEDDIADLSGQFTLQVIPELFALAAYFPASRFLQAQSKVSVLAWIGLVGLILQTTLLWLFIYVFDWGTFGAATAYNISNWFLALAEIIYIMNFCKESWNGFSWDAFNGLWAFLKLSLASAVMLCLEIWYMASMVILTGHLDNAVIAVGALSICTNLNGLEGMVFIGINAAISVRVSNELGAGRPRATKYSVYVTVAQSFLLGLLFMVVILITKDYFAIIFTSNDEMKEAVSNLAYLLGFTMVLNSVQPVISGVAVGAGWQSLVAYINVACYYVFGLPLGYLLGYKANWGVKGIWLGMIAGTALQTLLLLIILYKTNWKKEVEETTERMLKWGGQNTSEKLADDAI